MHDFFPLYFSETRSDLSNIDFNKLSLVSLCCKRVRFVWRVWDWILLVVKHPALTSQAFVFNPQCFENPHFFLKWQFPLILMTVPSLEQNEKIFYKKLHGVKQEFLILLLILYDQQQTCALHWLGIAIPDTKQESQKSPSFAEYISALTESLHGSTFRWLN